MRRRFPQLPGLLGLLVTLSGPVLAQPVTSPVPDRTLTVTGRGVENIPYTDAVFNLGVQADGKTASEAQEKVRSLVTPLIDRLKQLQVEKLQTTSVQLFTRYSNRPDRPEERELIGFTGRNTVRFQVPIAQAGRVLDASVGNGANTVQSLSFSAPEAQLAQARNVALGRAVVDAQSQADAVLKSLGLSAKQVRSVQVERSFQSVVSYSPEVASLSARSTPIEGGNAQVEALVTMQIGY